MKEKEPRIAGINIQDDSFYAGSDEWLREFCAKWKREIGLPFIARMIPRYISPARLEWLKDAGLQYVTMGLEGSDHVNREVYGRKETAASFLKGARTVLESGLWLSIDYIIHNPYETEEDLRAVARTLNALPRRIGDRVPFLDAVPRHPALCPVPEGWHAGPLCHGCLRFHAQAQPAGRVSHTVVLD